MFLAQGYMTSHALSPGVKQTWVQIQALPLTSCCCWFLKLSKLHFLYL